MQQIIVSPPILKMSWEDWDELDPLEDSFDGDEEA